MASLSQAKTLGGVGSLLLLLSPFVPFAGLVLFIVGIVLVLVAVRHVADVMQDRAVFTNMLIFVVLAIVAFAVLTLFVLVALFPFIGFPGVGTGFEIVEPPDFTEGDVIAFIVAIIVGVLVAWILYLVAAIFMKRSYDAIAERLGVSMFRTTALIFLIGAALLIVLIGTIVIFVAGILQIVAFFSIPEQLPQPAMATTRPPAIPPPE